LSRTSGKAGKQYEPSTVRQEKGKLATLAKYQDWHDAYLNLKKSKPGMGDVWYSNQIAKMVIAQDAKPGTIRKNMK